MKDTHGMGSLVVASLDGQPSLAVEARRLVEQYIRLPDAWDRFGGVPATLPYQFRQEIDQLPGQMVPPAGDLLVGVRHGVAVAVGCIAPLDTGRCEFKRVFVADEHRGTGVGAELIGELLVRARSLGYERVAIDVMPERLRALDLWYRYGFTDCDPYRDYGFEMVFLDRSLPAAAPGSESGRDAPA